MIQLKITHLGHSAKLTFPAKYERVALALWTIGLDRDPEKYTLRRLGAEFTSTTEEESQMISVFGREQHIGGSDTSFQSCQNTDVWHTFRPPRNWKYCLGCST